MCPQNENLLSKPHGIVMGGNGFLCRTKELGVHLITLCSLLSLFQLVGLVEF